MDRLPRAPTPIPGGRPWWPLALALAGAAVVFGPITGISFHDDDLFLLFQFTNDPLPLALTRPFLGHANLTRNAVLAATLAAFGPTPEAFQGTVLLGHLVAVALLFGVIRRATGDALVACLGALLWGTCPTNIGTLGWYAAFGHTLCTIFTLLALRIVLVARDAPDGLTPRRLAGCALLLAAGATSFGAGLGLALAFPAVVWLLAPPAGSSRPAWAATAAIPAAALAVYFGQRVVFVALGGTESETSILAGGLRVDPAYAVDLLAQLMGFGTASLIAGPFAAARVAWPTPGLALVVAGAALLALLAAWLGPARERRILLAAAVLVLAAYGSVVIGRGGLVVMFEELRTRAGTAPRYHYAAQAWIALGLATSLAMLLRRLPAERARMLVTTAIVVVLVTHLVRPRAFDRHTLVRRAIAQTLDDVRTAAAAAPAGSVVRIPNRRFPAAPFLAGRPEVFPGIAGVFLIFHPKDDVDGRRIVFEAARGHVADARTRGGRIASLLVPPPDDRPDPTF